MLSIKKLVFLLRTLFLALLFFSTSVYCQSSETKEQNIEISPYEEVLERRAEFEKDLSLVRSNIEKIVKESGPDEVPDVLLKQLEGLRNLDLVLEQHQVALEKNAALLRNFSSLEGQIEEFSRTGGLLSKEESTFLGYERLRDELVNAQESIEAGKKSVEAKMNTLEVAKQEFSSRESQRRYVKEQTQQLEEDQVLAELTANLELKFAQLDSRRSEEYVKLQEQELNNLKLQNKVDALRVKLVNLKLKKIGKEIAFVDGDLKQIMQEIDAKGLRLDRLLESSKNSLREAQNLLNSTQTKFLETSGIDKVLVEKILSHRYHIDAYQTAVSLLGRQLQRLSEQKQIWSRRYKLFNQNYETEEPTKWLEEAEVGLSNLQQESHAQEHRRETLRKQFLVIEDKLLQLDNQNLALKKQVLDQQRATKKFVRIFEDNANSITDTRKLSTTLVNEINDRLDTYSILDNLTLFWEWCREKWNYEIYVTDDDHSITVRKIVIGLFLIVLGVFCSQIFSRVLTWQILPKLRLDDRAATALGSLSFYFFLICFVLLALRVANVPLTAFTFVGGAVAIGIGFGSQNIVNNFMSGLILLIEQPVTVGDLIEFEGEQGRINRIGMRSTIVRNSANIDVIVPNSAFLEKNVINYTLNDTRILLSVSVGVAYGSPVETVVEVLKEAIKGVDKVEANAEPIILFDDFGDSALEFEVHFWSHIQTHMEKRIVESSVRHRVHALLQEAGITIAFPQRDVHLNSVTPIEVKMLGK